MRRVRMPGLASFLTSGQRVQITNYRYGRGITIVSMPGEFP